MTGRPFGQGAPLKSVLARWDAVVEQWALDEVERSSLLGGIAADCGGVADVAAYDTPKAEERMRLVVELSLLLDRVHGSPERTREWLRVPNRHLGHASPLEVMASSTAWMRWLVDHAGLTS